VLVTSQQPLDYEPGSKWKYCSTGIDALGRIIEVVSGQSYESFLQHRIFEPLGMHDTTFYPSPEQRERLAQICKIRYAKLVADKEDRVPDEKPKNPNPSGGLYSTGSDLARVYQMMLRRGEFDGHQIQTGPLECGFSKGMSYGLGFGVVREPQEVTEALSPGTFGHGGRYGTQFWIDPKRDLFMVLLIQRLGLKPNADRTEMRSQLQSMAVKAIQP
jgi:CubicO group peptidase (beta-lactamase class C family)